MSSLKPLIYSVLNIVSFFLPKNRAAILLYHSVGDDDWYLTVSRECFAQQMAWLKQKEYTVIRLHELVSLLRDRKEIPPKTLVLTFDDGYANFLRNILPVLDQHKFPATLFVPTGLLGKAMNNSENKPLPLLREEELRSVARSILIDIEPHSVTHRELTELSETEIAQEIRTSKEYLENLLGRTCRSFAYPRGKVNAAALRAVKASGLESAVTVQEGLVGGHADLFLLPRNTINQFTEKSEFLGKLNFSSRIISSIR